MILETVYGTIDAGTGTRAIPPITECVLVLVVLVVVGFFSSSLRGHE